MKWEFTLFGRHHDNACVVEYRGTAVFHVTHWNKKRRLSASLGKKEWYYVVQLENFGVSHCDKYNKKAVLPIYRVWLMSYFPIQTLRSTDFFMARHPPSRPAPLIIEASRSNSAGLLWTGDQSVTETSTTQHTTADCYYYYYYYYY
jgi:hypothetical protein